MNSPGGLFDSTCRALAVVLEPRCLVVVHYPISLEEVGVAVLRDSSPSRSISWVHVPCQPASTRAKTSYCQLHLGIPWRWSWRIGIVGSPLMRSGLGGRGVPRGLTPLALPFALAFALAMIDLP